MAGHDDISTDRESPTPAPAAAGQPARLMLDPERNPLSQLNEAAQAGVIAELDWDMQHAGPPHAPVFTATATATAHGQVVSASAEGASKAAARTAAGWGLLGRLADGDSEHSDQQHREVAQG
jgi:dsRNA-specific ribonuclease